MGLMGLIMACYGGLWGILSGLTKSTDHPSRGSFLSCFEAGLEFIGSHTNLELRQWEPTQTNRAIRDHWGLSGLSGPFRDRGADMMKSLSCYVGSMYWSKCSLFWYMARTMNPVLPSADTIKSLRFCLEN